MALGREITSTRVGAGLSRVHDPREAGITAARTAAEGLSGADADLAVVFASGAHLAAPEAALEGVHEVLGPESLVGCGASGVLGDGQELEEESALAVWAAAFGAGHAIPFHAAVGSGPGAGEVSGAASAGLPRATGSGLPRATGSGLPSATITGLPQLRGSSGAIMLSDPYSFPTDAVLPVLAHEAPDAPVLGGMSSARTPEGEAALFYGDRVCESGAVGVAFEGVELLPCVSQGAAPLGREVSITAAEGNVLHELAGRPALETIERLIAELAPEERALVAQGLLIGIVIDPGKPEYEQGDFLVRGVLGADRESGSLIVGATVAVGQVVRIHARDASSADQDLRSALRRRMQAIGGDAPAGALVFSCNGRGSSMFGTPGHDAMAVQRELHGAPAAGFFAAGEIGPVGSRSFLHGFTATVAVFPKA